MASVTSLLCRIVIIHQAKCRYRVDTRCLVFASCNNLCKKRECREGWIARPVLAENRNVCISEHQIGTAVPVADSFL